jgi:hypothetical protein
VGEQVVRTILNQMSQTYPLVIRTVTKELIKNLLFFKVESNLAPPLSRSDFDNFINLALEPVIRLETIEKSEKLDEILEEKTKVKSFTPKIMNENAKFETSDDEENNKSNFI